VDYRLLYTQRALNDLAEIIGHIAGDDVQLSALVSFSALCLINIYVQQYMYTMVHVEHYATFSGNKTTGVRAYWMQTLRSAGSKRSAWASRWVL
jgi:hypothetical protein